MYSRVIKLFPIHLPSRPILEAVTIALVVLVAFLQPATHVSAADPQSGIDCGCSKVGPYVDPAAPEPLSITRPLTSPSGKYKVEVVYGSLKITSLSVIRISDSREIVWLGALPLGTYWDFSPDDGRFALYAISGSDTSYYLYNLERATNPGVPVWDTLTTLVDTEAVFSPNGRFFQYAWVDFGMTYLIILDARTGQTIYQTSFSASIPPSNDEVRVASWGYSPDASDRTFVYAYVSSQIVSSVYWAVVNLDTGIRVREETLTNAVGSQGLLPFWQFSPCGDAIGLVNMAGNTAYIKLFATRDGTSLTPSEVSVSITPTLALKNNLTIHYVDTGSPTVKTLADNIADQSCSGGGGGTTPRPSGIDCGCSATGSYKNPAAPVPLSIQPTDSPHGKYRVVWQYGSNQITSLQVFKIGDPSQLIVSLGALPSATFWSFSSDDDRFALYSITQDITGSQTSYSLYNLVRAQYPGTAIWHTTTPMLDTEAAFSPHGRYFQYAWVNNGMTYLTFLDAQTGALIYQTNFTAAPPPGNSKVRVASWGYSPDASDRTFVYAYVNSQIVSSVYWGVINLATKVRVHDEMLVNAVNSQTIQPFWKFSSCGDAIGLVNTAVTPTNIRLFATKDGTSLNPGGLDITTTYTLALKNNLASHYADTGSATYTLADNTADAVCSVTPGEIGLKSITVSSASVLGGGTVQGTVTLTQAAPSGGVTISLTSDTSAAQVPASIKVSSGYSSASFSIATSEVSEETTAYISAVLQTSTNTTTNTATLTINPSPIASLTMNHYAIIAGTTGTATLTLRDPAPAGGAVIWLYPSGSFWTLTWVRIPEGEKSVTFDVTANLNIFSSEGTLTATYLNASKTVDLIVLRAATLTATPAEITGGEDTVTITVGLSDGVLAPEGGIVVPLNVDPTDIIDVPPSVTIEAGQTSASITASVIAVDEDADITIIAGLPEDTESPTATVHVLATLPSAFPGGPYMVLAGQAVTLTGDGTDPRGQALTFAWDLDGDETFETAGTTAVFTNTAGQNREVPVWFRACNTSGLCGVGQTFVWVRNPGHVWMIGPGPLLDEYPRNDLIGMPVDPTPVLVEGFGEVIQVAAGDGFVAAVRTDGTVWTMGKNSYGQLGNRAVPTGTNQYGQYYYSSVPVQAEISDVIAISATASHVMALKKDGTVWTWGENDRGQLGNGTPDPNAHPIPQPVEVLSNIIAIDTDRGISFAMTRRADIFGMGLTINVFGKKCSYAYGHYGPCRIKRLYKTVAFDGSPSWGVYLKQDGTVWFWGDVDPVTMEDRYDSEQIDGFSEIRSIYVYGGLEWGGASVLAVKNDGTVWGYGNNRYGQLGEDPTIQYPPYMDDYIGPVQIPGLTGARAVVGGEAFAAAILQDGTVAGWGWHSCPTGGCPHTWLPTPMAGLTNVQAIAIGDDFWTAIIPGTPVSRIASVTVQSDEAATLILPNERGQIDFPAGLVSVPTTFTYTEQDAPGQDLGSDTFAGLSFTLDATDPENNPVTSFLSNYTIQINYQDSDWQNVGIADENLLNLAYWDAAANQWVNVLPCEGCSLETEQNRLVAGLNHLTEFALLASPYTSPSSSSVTVQPDEAATLILPNERGQIDFPAGLVSVPTTFTYTEQDAPGQDLGSDTFAGLSFTLDATDPDGNAVTSFLASYTVRLNYQDSDWQNAGIADESLLNLAYWDASSGQWLDVLPCEGCSVDLAQNHLVAVLNHLTEFALLASPNTTSSGASVLVQPDTETTMTLPNSQGEIIFPPGLVSAPTTFKYMKQDTPGESLGSYTFAGISFTLEASDADGNAVASFPVSYTIRLTYQDSDWQNAGIPDENLLNLAYWDTAAGQWVNVLPCEGCSLDPQQNTLVAVLDHLTEFALLASIPADSTPPTTSASLSPEVGASGWYTEAVTVTLTASDSDSGVQNTEYNLNGAGWTPYSAPFVVSSESTGSDTHNTVQYRSTDMAGNVEETNSLTIQIDMTAPTIKASVPLSGFAVEGGIKFGVTMTDALSGPTGATLSIREADGANGKEIGHENLDAVYNNTSGIWELAERFDTTQLPDGFYVLAVTGTDAAGNEKTAIIPFSVRNWAVLELLPATENNKAGRTMPVKFSLRVVEEVDAAQPFVYSEELTIEIYKTGQPETVLQSATFGPQSKDYRISVEEEMYVTNFQTSKTPMQYTVEVLRGALSIGKFGFQTTK